MTTLRDDDDKAPPVHGRLDPHDDAAMRAWAQRFGVTLEELLDAIRTVGDDAEKVQQFLAGGGNRVP